MQENQQAAQIAARHNIFPQMGLYIMSWIFLVLVGIDPGISGLGGEIVSHNMGGVLATNHNEQAGGCVVKVSARGSEGRRFDTWVHQLSD